MALKDLNHREVIALVGELVQATKADAIEWGQASDGSDFFYLETGGGIVNIESLSGGDHPFVLRLFNDDKKVYELQTEIAPFYEPDEELVAQLFAVAKDSIYDVSGTVDRIRRSLGL